MATFPPSQSKQTTSSKATSRQQNKLLSGRATLAALAALLIIVLISGSVAWYLQQSQNDEQYNSFAGTRVEQKVTDLPPDLKIGLVVSYTEDAAQGAGWDSNGEAITVAKWRLAQANNKVKTVVVSDQGSAVGASAAIEKLKNNQVSGIIALTTGSHTKQLSDAASKAGLPIIFPYQTASARATSGVWYGLPQINQWRKQLNEVATRSLHCTPLISIDQVMNPTGEIDTAQMASRSKQLLGNSTRGCILIDSTPRVMANAIKALQAQEINAKIIVGSAGTNTTFITELSESGIKGQNIYSLAPLNQGTANSCAQVGFREAQAIMETDHTLKSLRADSLFFERADLADRASYEAFMALLRAAAKADSAEPQKVSSSLAALQVPSADSIDGVKRDYSHAVYQTVALAQLVEVGEQGEWVTIAQN